MGFSDGETQSSLKQSPALVLFGKRPSAVLNRTPDPLSDSSILFISVPEPFDIKTGWTAQTK